MSFTAPTLTPQMIGEANMRLGRIEAEENVSILFAVESGSRAWGFPSPDSDYDVRFFYVRPLADYLSLEPKRDTIERPISDDWDLNGWDLRKALGLLVKGNATVSEWLSSPLIYREHGPFPYHLRDLIKRHATVERAGRHYYGLTNKTFRSEIDNRAVPLRMEGVLDKADVMEKGLSWQVNYKAYLYAVRGAMAIAWIKAYKEIPPMTLPALMSTNSIPFEVRTDMERLLAAKATMGEVGRGVRIASLDTFIAEQIAWAKGVDLDEVVPNDVLAAEADRLLLEALGVR